MIRGAVESGGVSLPTAGACGRRSLPRRPHQPGGAGQVRRGPWQIYGVPHPILAQVLGWGLAVETKWAPPPWAKCSPLTGRQDRARTVDGAPRLGALNGGAVEKLAASGTGGHGGRRAAAWLRPREVGKK